MCKYTYKMSENYDIGLKLYNEKQYAKAIEYFKLATDNDNGNANAQNNLGNIYLNGGNGVKTSYRIALEYFQLAADKGNAEAQNNLGNMYLDGKGVETSYQKALEYFQLAADNGNAEAQNNLGYMYLNGKGVKTSYQKAFEYFKLSADNGYSEAQSWVAYMYKNGYGVEQSYQKAVEYYELAIDNGNLHAHISLDILKSSTEYIHYELLQQRKKNELLEQRVEILETQNKYIIQMLVDMKIQTQHFESLTSDV